MTPSYASAKRTPRGCCQQFTSFISRRCRRRASPLCMASEVENVNSYPLTQSCPSDTSQSNKRMEEYYSRLVYIIGQKLPRDRQSGVLRPLFPCSCVSINELKAARMVEQY